MRTGRLAQFRRVSATETRASRRCSKGAQTACRPRIPRKRQSWGTSSRACRCPINVRPPFSVATYWSTCHAIPWNQRFGTPFVCSDPAGCSVLSFRICNGGRRNTSARLPLKIRPRRTPSCRRARLEEEGHPGVSLTGSATVSETVRIYGCMTFRR